MSFPFLKSFIGFPVYLEQDPAPFLLDLPGPSPELIS